MHRYPVTHNLKTVDPFFEWVVKGVKDFEIRFDDRDFLVGDIVNLQEYKSNILTGQNIKKEIKYILRKNKGLQDGYVILGLKNIETQVE